MASFDCVGFKLCTLRGAVATHDSLRNVPHAEQDTQEWAVRQKEWTVREKASHEVASDDRFQLYALRPVELAVQLGTHTSAGAKFGDAMPSSGFGLREEECSGCSWRVCSDLA